MGDIERELEHGYTGRKINLSIKLELNDAIARFHLPFIASRRYLPLNVDIAVAMPTEVEASYLAIYPGLYATQMRIILSLGLRGEIYLTEQWATKDPIETQTLGMNLTIKLGVASLL